MRLKDFVECFENEETIRVKLAGEDRELYNGDADTLRKLLIANIKRNSGKFVDGATLIEVTPY